MLELHQCEDGGGVALVSRAPG